MSITGATDVVYDSPVTGSTYSRLTAAVPQFFSEIKDEQCTAFAKRGERKTRFSLAIYNYDNVTPLRNLTTENIGVFRHSFYVREWRD